MKLLLSFLLCGGVCLGARAATFTVINTNNADAGSLRQAILAANSNAGPDTIQFAITNSVLAILVSSNLPAITEPVTVNGATQAGYSNAPIVELSGGGIAGGLDGLRINTSNTTVRALVIRNFTGDGIEINGGGSNVVEGCYIGLNLAGATDQGNALNGILITNSANNRIGGTNTATLPNIAQGRYITAAATDPSGNTSEFATNIIATTTLPPVTFAVVNTNDNGPGSLRQALLDAAARISTTNDTIAFSIPGTGVLTITPTTALPIILEPVTIDGYTQTGSISNSLANGNNAVHRVRALGQSTRTVFARGRHRLFGSGNYQPCPADHLDPFDECDHTIGRPIPRHGQYRRGKTVFPIDHAAGRFQLLS